MKYVEIETLRQKFLIAPHFPFFAHHFYHLLSQHANTYEEGYNTQSIQYTIVGEIWYFKSKEWLRLNLISLTMVGEIEILSLYNG